MRFSAGAPNRNARPSLHILVQLSIRCRGLGAQADLKIELLDNHERPLPGFSGKDAAVVRQNGFHTPLSWKGQEAIAGLPDRIRLKVTFEGERKTGIRFSALYVQMVALMVRTP